jgi:hypothetical protein
VARPLHAHRLEKPHGRFPDLVPRRRSEEFTKLYSDVPADKALILPPHPTLLYNTQNGAPSADDKHGLMLEGRFYRSNTSWTNGYWWDGKRRRKSKATIVAGFLTPIAHRARLHDHRPTGNRGRRSSWFEAMMRAARRAAIR